MYERPFTSTLVRRRARLIPSRIRSRAENDVGGHIATLKHMAKKDPCARLRESIKRRASQTHDCLETCLENVSRGPQRDADGLVCSKLAELGYLEQLKEARRLDFPWNEWTSANAAMNGHLKCLKYAHERECPWDWRTCYYATRNGHLECLKYAHEHGCPWDERTCMNAARSGQLECLKYAHENGCPWNEWTCALAAMDGELECLKYARERGCPWDETREMAAENGHEFMSMDTYVQYTNN